ncbi:MAG: hypothetical protein IKD04_03775 [Clostridia bacterium]|nr:hypothetical protein [Clostridia bacterium]
MILKRKVIGIILLLSVVFTVCFVTADEEHAADTASTFQNRPQIILDAGHEGFS